MSYKALNQFSFADKIDHTFRVNVSDENKENTSSSHRLKPQKRKLHSQSSKSVKKKSETFTSKVGLNDKSKVSSVKKSASDINWSFKQSLIDSGFSTDLVNRIAAPQRSSTRQVYDAKVLGFKNWCIKNKKSFKKPSIKHLAEYFLFLFTERKLCPGTISNCRSAIADHYNSDELDIGHNKILTRLIVSFFKDNPPSSREVNPWNLALVLDSFKKPPYEPMSKASRKYITLKTIFLISLASGRRRSEIHALVFKGIKWSQGNSIVSLPVHFKFLAKNQKSTDSASKIKPIVVPSLSDYLGEDLVNTDDRLLCPVRALKFYLDKTKSLRKGDRKKLFLSFFPNKTQDIHKNTVSGWLKQCVTFGYSHHNKEIPKGIKAHQVRGVSASWAWRGGISMDKIMDACFWKSHNTFTSYYLKDCWSENENGEYSLGPIVVSGSIVTK